MALSIKKSNFQKKPTYKWWVLYSVAIGMFMAFLDTSILNISFPRLVEVFGTGPSVVVWINIVYLIMTQSFMLFLAKIGDLKGRKKVYLAGLACYAVGLVICALSKTITHLFIGRVVQGIGAGAVLSLSMAIAVAVFPATERGKALGILASTRALGIVSGPVFGGLILGFLGWRGIFYARLPFILLSFALVWVVIEEQKDSNSESRFKLDFLGSGSFFCWLSGLLLFFGLGGRLGFSANPVLGLGTLVTAFFIILILIEKKSAQPFIDISLFGKPLFAASVTSAVMQGAASIMVVSLAAFYLIGGLGYSTSMAGFFVAAVSIPSLFIAPISGRLSDRFGSRMLSTFGMSLMFTGLYLLTRLGSNPTAFLIVIVLAVFGTGLGIFQAPNNSCIVGSVPRDKLGTAAAIATAATQLGVSGGLAIGGAVFDVRLLYHSSLLLDRGFAPSFITKQSIISSFNETLIIAIIFAGIGTLASLIRGSEHVNVGKQ
jgi:EmrB/QacA subfamily drug resistance transporter